MATNRSSSFWKSEAATAVFLACLVFSFFFRAHWGFQPGWGSDDGCYLSLLGSWIQMQVPAACPFPENFYAPGAPIAWLPAGLLGTPLSFLTDIPKEEWVVPLVSLWSFVLWGMSLVQLTLFFQDQKLELPRIKGSNALLALLVLLCAPALYYATHRTTMAHSAELFFAISFLRFLEKKRWAWALGFASLLTLTRYNDAPVFLLILGKLADSQGGLSSRMRWLIGTWIALALAGVGWIAFFRGYWDQTFFTLFQYLRWEGLTSFWIGADFGVLWTAPWLVSAWILGAVLWRKLGWCARGAWTWIALEFFLAISWGGNGGDFGYRYLIGCYAGAILLWLDSLRAWNGSFTLARFFKILTVTNAFFLTYVLISYKTISGTGAHNPLAGVNNPDLLLKLIRAPWTRPEVLNVAFHQQIPAVTFFTSLLTEKKGFIDSFGVTGPGLLCLGVAVTATLCFIALYLLKTVASRMIPESSR